MESSSSHPGSAPRKAPHPAQALTPPPPPPPPPGVALITGAEVDLAYNAAQCVVKTHQRLVEFLKVGQTLAAIDTFVARTLAELSCRSCFVGYRVGRSPAFPSHACLSVNDCIVHGTAGSHQKPLKAGDVLKVDIGVWHKGFIGDAAWTYTFKEFPSPEVERLVRVGRESLRRGIAAMQPGAELVEFARAVQTCVETEAKFHLTRGLGGHGIGRKLHGPPYVSNVVPGALEPHGWAEARWRWTPGMLVAVEPMLAIGTSETKPQGRGADYWPVYTTDGSIAAHFEHDVLITDSGNRVLTEGLDELPLVVG